MTIFEPDGPDDTILEQFDLKMLLGWGLIAWAFACSIGLALHFS